MAASLAASDAQKFVIGDAQRETPLGVQPSSASKALASSLFELVSTTKIFNGSNGFNSSNGFNGHFHEIIMHHFISFIILYVVIQYINIGAPCKARTFYPAYKLLPRA